jgi:hypothetical protein
MSPQDGVFGCGKTAEAAIAAWDKELKRHLAENDEEDFIVGYVHELLCKEVMSKSLRGFYNQFKP